jgi:large subunit ribosomal protein L1
MNKEAIIKAIRKAKKCKKRNFVQSVDLIVNLKHIDLKKPTNHISGQVTLPAGRGKPVKIGVIAEGDLAVKAKKITDKVLGKADLDNLKKDKKLAKRLAKECDFFVVQSTLMTHLAKTVGPVLGPRGKMPKPGQILTPTSDPEKVIANLNKIININVKKQPVLHALIGSEQQSDEELFENIMAVLSFLEHHLENPTYQIGKIFIKTTMGQPVLVEG